MDEMDVEAVERNTNRRMAQLVSLCRSETYLYFTTFIDDSSCDWNLSNYHGPDHCHVLVCVDWQRY